MEGGNYRAKEDTEKTQFLLLINSKRTQTGVMVRTQMNAVVLENER